MTWVLNRLLELKVIEEVTKAIPMQSRSPFPDTLGGVSGLVQTHGAVGSFLQEAGRPRGELPVFDFK